MMTLLRDRAPAKVNLSLHVGPPKPNGRHDLISLVSFGGEEASDLLEAEPATSFSLALEGPFAKDTGQARDNLVLKAARALNEALDGNAPPLAFRLTKTLPCAAGIGGGSADAAAALRILVKAHGGDRVEAIARDVAPTLGGDVLACFHGIPGLMRGEGERYQPLLDLPALPALLVNPMVPCPTGPVFKAYDEHAPSSLPDHALPPAGRARESRFSDWLRKNTHNGLESPAKSLVPDIKDVLEALRKMKAANLVRMSGSGATCFALFDRMEEAEAAAETLEASQPDWWVCPTFLGVR